MGKSTVMRCTRPQCMAIYSENTKNRYCDCGALLQITAIESKPKNNSYKKTVKPAPTPKTPEKAAYLYLLLDDDEVEFKLKNITRIGRAADSVQVDIDLTEYAGKDVSREHAVLTREKDGWHITNVSRNHSVRILDKDENETAIEYGKKELLKSNDGILLSKKVLFQFIEEE